MFSVCLFVRFQSYPKESHLSPVKRILRYFHGTMNLGLWYPKGIDFEITSYSGADFVGCQTYCKSISGTCHFFGYALMSWFSKKKILIALSTTEAKYISTASCCAQILWKNKYSWILV